MLKKLVDLTREELYSLYEVNYTLRNMAFDYVIESANDLVNSILSDIPRSAARYSFGFSPVYNEAYFKIENIDTYGAWVNRIDECILSDEGSAKLEKALLLNDRLICGYWYGDSISVKNGERMEARLNELIAELETETRDYIQSEYDYWNDDKAIFEELFDLDLIGDFFPENATTDGKKIYYTVETVAA